MKQILFLALCLISLNANAQDVKIMGEIQWMSDYVSRGVSQNNNEPVLQGWIGLNHKLTTVGVFTTQVYMPVSLTEVAKKYNLYFVDQYLPISKSLFLNFKFWYYDYLQYSKLNQHEFLIEVIYNSTKLSVMHNPNYLGIGTSYNYIYLSQNILLSDKDSVEILVATGLVEKPELVNIRTYQEAKITYTKDIQPVKVFASFSDTNREKYFSKDKYHDSSLFFGVKLNF